MSSYKENFVIENDSENVKQSCRYAFKEMQVMVKKEEGNEFIANEKFSFGFSNPAKIEVSVIPEGDSTTLKLKVSNMGFGPIQGKHCLTVANTFINAVKFKSSENSSIESKSSDADELKKFADLKDQGIITEDEFQAKKKKLLDLWNAYYLHRLKIIR